MPTFELDREPWIPVVGADGTGRSVNLVELFGQAHEILRLDGSPPEVAAITRFLLAVGHLTDTPTSLEAWGRLWQSRTEFMERCARYVVEHPGVWDLFNESHPFGQCPGLSKTLNPAHLHVYDAARKNNAVLADHSMEAEPAPISAAALARGLVTVNAYAGSSGGGYRSGPLAMRTVAMLSGCTLDETLLLNLLVQGTSPEAYDWTSYGSAPVATGVPSDLARRYLWAARRVRFIPEKEGTAVRTMMLSPGDEMAASARSEDPMVVMRKDSKGTDYVPLRLESGRALWRSAHVLLTWHEDAQRLAAVDQLRRLLRRGIVSAEQPVSLRVCGVAGDAQGPATEFWRDETLPFGLSVVADDARFASLEQAIGNAEEAARRTGGRIKYFAAQYLQNGSASKADDKDVSRLFDELCPGLSDFWGALAQAGERIACEGFNEEEWAELLKHASEQAYRRAVDRLPADARRYRAEFAVREGDSEKKDSRKQKKGARA